MTIFLTSRRIVFRDVPSKQHERTDRHKNDSTPSKLLASLVEEPYVSHTSTGWLHCLPGCAKYRESISRENVEIEKYAERSVIAPILRRKKVFVRLVILIYHSPLYSVIAHDSTPEMESN